MKKNKKLQIIIPLAILGKLVHLKFLIIQVLFGVGTIQLTLLGAAGAIFYYLKHKTLCKVEPHLITTHSHVAETAIPGRKIFCKNNILNNLD